MHAEATDVVHGLELDQRLATLVARVRGGTVEVTDVERRPVSRGRVALALSHVRLRTSDGQQLDLVEKVVAMNDRELAVWDAVTGTGELTPRSDRYVLASPLATTRGELVAVLHLPYLSGFHSDVRERRRSYRRAIDDIVAAVADLGGRNPVTPADARAYPDDPLTAVPPDPVELERVLEVPRDRAVALRRAWDAVHERVETVARPVLARLPVVLSHGDVSPGNTAVGDGPVRFVDLGLGGARPVGSDLATVLRWTFRRLERDGHVARLVATYVDALPASLGPVDPADVRLALWVAYFRRYTDLSFRSAQHLGSFEAAVQRLGAELDERR